MCGVLMFEMREKLKEVGIQRGLGPGIDIVYLRDKFYVTMSLGASLRFSLSIAHMFGFLHDNFALMSQYSSISTRCSTHVVGVGGTTRITPTI